MARDVSLIISANADKADAEIRKMQATGTDCASILEREFQHLGISSELSIERQRAAYQAAFDRIKASGTASAQEITRAQEAMQAKMAGLGLPVQKAEASIKQMVTSSMSELSILGGGFGQLAGMMGTLGTIAIGAGIALFIKGAVDDTIKWNLEALKLSKTLGTSTENASIFMVAMHSVGVDTDTAAMASLRMAKSLTSNEEVYKRLGVAIRDSNGNYRATTDIMTDVNEKLNNMSAGTDRNIIAMQIYGRGWGEIQGLLKINKQVMEEARETAERLHLVVGEEGVRKAREYQRAMREIEMVHKSVSVQIGNELLPPLTAIQVAFGDIGVEISPLIGYMLKLAHVVGIVQSQLLMLDELKAGKNFIKNLLGGKSLSDTFSEFGTELDEIGQITKDKIDKVFNPATKKGLIDPQRIAADKAAIESVAASVEKYAKSIESLGKDQLEWAKSGFSEDLKRQQDLLKDNVLNLGNLEAPLRNYLAVIGQVYDQQLSMEKAIGQTLFSIGAEQSKIAQQNIVLANVEKNALNARLSGWTQYLSSLKSMHSAAMAALVKDEQALFDIHMKTGDLTNQVQQQLMSPMERYYAQIQALDDKQRLAMGMNSDQKIKLLESVQQSWASLTSEVSDGSDTVVSKEEAVYAALAKIRDIGTEMERTKAGQIGAEIDAINKLETEMKRASDMVSGYQTRIRELDNTIAALTRTFDLTLNDKASSVIHQVKGALDALQDKTITITAVYNPVYADAGLSTPSLPSYDVGTPRVTRTGPALVHYNEAILKPAEAERYRQGQMGGVNITIPGGISVVVQGGGSSQGTAREIARQIYPEIKKLAANDRQ
jgi:hypothetical protein